MFKKIHNFFTLVHIMNFAFRFSSKIAYKLRKLIYGKFHLTNNVLNSIITLLKVMIGKSSRKMCLQRAPVGGKGAAAVL